LRRYIKGLVSVRPVVARIPDDFVPVLNRDEVDNSFTTPLEGFLSTQGQGLTFVLSSAQLKRILWDRGAFRVV
jgi:hypothetical protein